MYQTGLFTEPLSEGPLPGSSVTIMDRVPAGSGVLLSGSLSSIGGWYHISCLRAKVKYLPSVKFYLLSCFQAAVP